MVTDENFVPVHHFIGNYAQIELALSQETLHLAGGYYASVGTLSDEERKQWEQKWHLKPFSSTTLNPLNIAYHTPETLGADRLATAIGAYSLFPGENILVLDFGTCLKCDFVSQEKSYEGGSISPGLDMRFKAMHTFTAKLPLLTRPKEFPSQPIGRSTAESMQYGVVLGMLAEAHGMIEFYVEKYSPLKVLITGGDAEVFEGRLKNAIFVRQNLALLGLAETKKHHANSANDK